MTLAASQDHADLSKAMRFIYNDLGGQGSCGFNWTQNASPENFVLSSANAGKVVSPMSIYRQTSTTSSKFGRMASGFWLYITKYKKLLHPQTPSSPTTVTSAQQLHDEVPLFYPGSGYPNACSSVSSNLPASRCNLWHSIGLFLQDQCKAARSIHLNQWHKDYHEGPMAMQSSRNQPVVPEVRTRNAPTKAIQRDSNLYFRFDQGYSHRWREEYLVLC